MKKPRVISIMGTVFNIRYCSYDKSTIAPKNLDKETTWHGSYQFSITDEKAKGIIEINNSLDHYELYSALFHEIGEIILMKLFNNDSTNFKTIKLSHEKYQLFIQTLFEVLMKNEILY